ncbi:MAG TPA: serine hydrolase domain-containing protein [Agromyces sp.]|nr:serine hydrolase domain-containing protein [Agromyces sp.]
MSTMENLRRTADALTSPSAGAPAGCVLGIDLDGVRTVVAAGIASPETSATLGAPMRRETVHDLASVSKVVGTTTALHRLVSEGQLDLDTLVVRLVPTFGGTPESTVRDLLHHRAGLWEWQPIYLAPDAADDPFAVVDALPLRYPPGRERHYSDLGFMTLGRVVAAASGAPLDAAIRDLVTDPLGLDVLGYAPVRGDVATSARDDGVERRMVATGNPYPVRWQGEGFGWRTGPIRGVANDGNCFHAFGGVAGHAGLFAPLDELLDLASALSRADDDPALWNPRATAEFFAPGPDPEQALGWRRGELVVDDERMPLLWHPGFTGTAVGFVPGRGIAIALATNRLLAAEPQPTASLWQRALDALPSIISAQE